jgi:hypothetical protein
MIKKSMDVARPVNLGAIERPRDPRDILLGSVQAPVSIPTTMHVDLSWLKRNFQGQTAFCGEHAATHLVALLDYYAGSTNRYSPRYGTAKLKSPASPVYDGFPISAGTTMTAIFKMLQKVGADVYEPLENDVFLPPSAYADPTAITPDMDASAATHKINSYAFDALTFEDMCQAIYQRKALIILAKVDNGFWGTSTPTFTSPDDGHFFVGYDFDTTTHDLFVIDSADPNDAFALKRIHANYITPQFFFETGTAIELPPAVKTALVNSTAAPIPPSVQNALTSGQVNLAEQILNDIEAALVLIKREL